MAVIFIVLPVALIVVLGAVVAYVWAARSGQFDDTTTPAVRVALEDDEPARGAAGEGPPPDDGVPPTDDR